MGRRQISEKRRQIEGGAAENRGGKRGRREGEAVQQKELIQIIALYTILINIYKSICYGKVFKNPLFYFVLLFILFSFH